MKKIIVVVNIFIVFLPIILSLTQYIPITDKWWGFLGTDISTLNDFRKLVISFIGINFSILTGLFLYKMDREKGVLKGLVSDVKNALEFELEGHRISDADFYRDFGYEASRAKNHVSICYFAPYPPSSTAHRDRKQYYRDIASTLKANEKVKFKRIVRDTEKNKEWIKGLVESLEGKPNADLAVLKKDLPEDEKMPLALSVQVIDNDKVWLVAIEDHERDNQFRDMFIKGETFALAMSGYYARLWKHSEKLVETGIITNSGRSYLES